MTANKPSKKFYTVAEANATLPLVRSILRDITALADDLIERHERLNRTVAQEGPMTRVYKEEWDHVHEELERDQGRLQEYEQELRKLGIHLKDYHQGLIDFPCWMEDREVYLCWKLDEPEVAHWHEVEAGFSGRQKLVPSTAHQG